MSTKPVQPTPPTEVYFTVAELKKMLNYAEQHKINNVKASMSGSSGIGVTTIVSKTDGSDAFDVTDVDSW